MKGAEVWKDIGEWGNIGEDFKNERTGIKKTDNEGKPGKEWGDWNAVFMMDKQKITKNNHKTAGKCEPVKKKKKRKRDKWKKWRTGVKKKQSTQKEENGKNRGGEKRREIWSSWTKNEKKWNGSKKKMVWKVDSKQLIKKDEEECSSDDNDDTITK